MESREDYKALTYSQFITTGISSNQKSKFEEDVRILLHIFRFQIFYFYYETYAGLINIQWMRNLSRLV